METTLIQITDVIPIKEVLAVTGIAGLILSIVFYLFRDIIQKNIFPKLTKEQSFKIIITIIIILGLYGLLGIAIYMFQPKERPDNIITIDTTKINDAGRKSLDINTQDTNKIQLQFIAQKFNIDTKFTADKTMTLSDLLEYLLNHFNIREAVKSNYDQTGAIEYALLINEYIQFNKTNNNITIRDAGINDNDKVSLLIYFQIPLKLELDTNKNNISIIEGKRFMMLKPESVKKLNMVTPVITPSEIKNTRESRETREIKNR